jgi:phosphoglycerol transferase MdoB-like AlkP superfamily enzyme
MTTSQPGDDDARPTPVDVDDAPTGAEGAASDAPDRPRWLRTLLKVARPARDAGLHLLFIVVLALVAQVLLEVLRTGGDWGYLGLLFETQPGVFQLGAFVLFLVVSGVHAVTGRMWVTAALVLTATTLLGMASHLKFEARREPLYPHDLVFVTEPGFLLEMVDPQVLWLTVMSLVLGVAAAWAVARLVSRRVRRGPRVRPSLPRRAAGLVVRVAVVGVCVTLLSSLLHFNHGENSWRTAYEDAGANWRRASQAANYEVNGFVGGFLYNLDTPAMRRPPSYSRAEMQRIVDDYSALAEARNEGRDPAALEDVNVVSVLSESFSDPMRLRGFTLAEDPIPRIRTLMRSGLHGRMLSQKVGGGTASMEFETLTGMSLAQFNSSLDTPYQMLVPRYDEFPSVVSHFNEIGHKTLAIHPYYSTLYQRHRVYPIFGFSDFDSIYDVTHDETLEENPYVSDEAAFQETLDAIGDHEEPVFINLVTMQNHAPYAGKYSDPFEVEGLTGEDAETVGQYARGLAYTDLALSRFVRQLEESDEKTIVLFYGDHLPARLPETVYKSTSFRGMRETPFFLYKNFGRVEPERLPTTSPVFFMPHVFELAEAPLSPYFTLLREVESHVTAMSHGKRIGPDNRRRPLETLSPEGQAVLRDYQLVQYDLSVGNRYAEDMLRVPRTETVSASDAAK